jgi:hypothetical protein
MLGVGLPAHNIREGVLSHSILSLVEPCECEALIREVNDFVIEAYTQANAIARKADILQDAATATEAFAFPVHSPGSPETAHLPGFLLSDLPDALAEVTRRAASALRLDRGRMLFSVRRFPPHAPLGAPRHEGKCLDGLAPADLHAGIRRQIRPSEVAILTLRNETERSGTTLHDAEDKVIETCARPGELLLFDNLIYRNGSAPTRRNVFSASSEANKRWARFTIGWHSLEEGYEWFDDQPLHPLRFEEAIEIHEVDRAEGWGERLAADLSRATFPFSSRYV